MPAPSASATDSAAARPDGWVGRLRLRDRWEDSSKKPLRSRVRSHISVWEKLGV